MKVWRRPSIGHADPLGGDFPLITREGHNVLDLIFTSPILNLGILFHPCQFYEIFYMHPDIYGQSFLAADVAESLNNVNGVVEHGVFTRNP